MTDQILVIKLGALGDFLQAAGPFAAIRTHHPDATITLLTTEPFRAFAEASPWFDRVWIDTRPKVWQVKGWLSLRRRLRSVRFRRVYDLQTSDRSSSYFRLMAADDNNGPEWSGIAGGCSLPHDNPNRDFMHTLDRQAEQLAMAGIPDVHPPSFSWVEAETARFGLDERYALLVPGGAAHRPDKRWPAEKYGQLALTLMARGLQPVLLGGGNESDLLEEIAEVAPHARSLAGETSIADIIQLAREAACAVGNDTGPMHAAALVGCPSVVLYSFASDPTLCAQRGPHVEILRRETLDDLSVDEVVAALPS